MAESICSCCKLLGKPPAQVNFIVVTGQPNTLIYPRMKNLLRTYSEISSYENDVRLTDYESLNTISAQLFKQQTHSPAVDEQVSNKTCCQGFTTIQVEIDEAANKPRLDDVEEDIRDLLGSKSDSVTEEEAVPKPVPFSWVMISSSVCSEPEFLKIFLRLSDEKSFALTFSFTILCFLVDEQRLFENWFFEDLPIRDYQSNTYPAYEYAVKDFFIFLKSSKFLQKHTLLMNEGHFTTDTELQRLLQSLYHEGSSDYRANNDRYRNQMSYLLCPRRRTMRDVRYVRNNLQKFYNGPVEDRLRPLLEQLKERTTPNAMNAARQITHIVLDEFQRMNDEEKRVYKRQLMLGFGENDVEESNTVTAQLVHLALHLLSTNDDTLMPLIYSIVRVIRRLGVHYIFRHHLFNHTPEIFQLSLLLIIRRQYPLTLAGLRLCTCILDADQIEHKYALEYLKHDPSCARKVLDAITWLLSPYIELEKLWKEERNRKGKDEESSEHSESTDDESAVDIAERFCSRHTDVLVVQPYIGDFASLFYGSTDHCAHVTKDDIQMFARVTTVLANPRSIRWSRGENKARLSLILISELCELMTPILLHGSSSVHKAFSSETSLFLSIPAATEHLLQIKNTKEDMIKVCLRFYTHLVQAKCKQLRPDDEQEQEEHSELPDTPPTQQQPIESLLSSHLSKDLISAYFDLNSQIEKISSSNNTSEQQDQFRKLLQEEWRRVDILQLQCDYKQLNDKHLSLQQELTRRQSELERTQTDRDQLRQENKRLAEEIDRQKHSATLPTTPVESIRSPITSPAINSDQTNMIDSLKSLSPEEITPHQAEQSIREIHHRRTTFNDPDMRKSICGSLKHLGSDLYSSPVHFLHELIQNAEDNFYADAVVPCLRIELDHTYILLSNNEKGLRAKDVLAICSLAVSTKTGQQDQLGEKGVGFKSVFAASNQPALISHAWRFQFRVPGEDAMAYITPLWLTDEDIPACITQQISVHPHDTYLHLPLKLKSHTPETETFLNQVITAADPCVLLNMRHLKKLELFDKRQNQTTIIEKHFAGPTKLVEKSDVTFEGFSFTHISGCVIKLCVSTQEDLFRVYTCQINVPNSIEQRRSPTTRLILAFPCRSDYQLTNTVYTGLPVCDLGFNFLFNADFQLVTNREHVRENAPFNTFIRDHLAALFIYLLLNDSDLQKDIHRYCPSTDTHQLKQSSWWHTMIDDINRLLNESLHDLFGIRQGKSIRYSNGDLVTLVSNDQLYNCADIHVIDTQTGFLTPERMKSLKIPPVSITDVLNCFPNRDETSTTIGQFREEFRLWAEKKEKNWWSQLFHQIIRTITSDIFDLMSQKPIFLLNNNHQRQFLPSIDEKRLLLFISDDLSFQSWKRQITLLQYSSESEKTALLKSNKVQRLTEEDLLKIIRDDHLQLAVTSLHTNAQGDLIEEIWKDLLYLRSRADKLDRTSPLLIPVRGTTNLSIIQNAILPTILGTDIRSCMHSTTAPVIDLPYYDTDRRQLIDILRWEHFLLEMNCQRPSIYIPTDSSLTSLPLLPSFSMFNNQESARLAQLILNTHSRNTKECLRQLPIVQYSKDQQQICPVSVAFDDSVIRDLPSLPRVQIPSYCRSLAIDLGVHVECDLRTCVTVLQLLSHEKSTDVDQYIQWLGHLQLYLCQQSNPFDSNSLLASCQLYLPAQNNFYPFKDLLITADNKDHHESILLVCKYVKLQWISPVNNEIYWPFKDLFRRLGCISSITINHVCNTLQGMTHEKSNFYALGDCNTTLKDSGMETTIILLQYLETLILACVKDKPENEKLYRAVIEKRHPTAPCGSRPDMEWRFSLTCNDLSKELRIVTDIKSRKRKISLPTIDGRLIAKTSENIVYGCLEMSISRNLSKDVGKRHFISPVISRLCPLVLATFDIDYVERRGKIEWIHENRNLEHSLNQLTEIFRDTIGNRNLQVVTAKYSRINLFLSDSFVIESIDQENEGKIDRCTFDTDYPFWIFGNIILLCSGYDTNDTTKAIIAISALTTLLHKRCYMPFDEAKSLAQEKINACTAFRSNQTASIAGTESGIYSYTDLLFPTNHESIESIIIRIGKYGIVEKDEEDDQTNMEVVNDRVAADRAAQDQIYRNRIRTQDDSTRSRETTGNRNNSIIVDGAETIRIGRNAEHYFFAHLQEKYGSAEVTPSKNWRSSARLATYPQYRRNINDSAGYDFELHDTRQMFVRGSKGTTKQCYFEVKGTSGSYSEEHMRFFISRNELEVCQAIAEDSTRREREAYFIVIIENCLDTEKTSLAVMIEWSSNLNRIYRAVESYQCRIVSSSSSSNNTETVTREPTNQDDRQEPSESSVKPNNDSHTVSTPFAASQTRDTETRTTNRYHGNASDTSSLGASRDNYPSSARDNAAHGQYQSPNYNNRYNAPIRPSRPMHNMYPNSFNDNPSHTQNQQQWNNPYQQNDPYNGGQWNHPYQQDDHYNSGQWNDPYQQNDPYNNEQWNDPYQQNDPYNSGQWNDPYQQDYSQNNQPYRQTRRK